MDPEKDTGNIEYKLKLIDKDVNKINTLTTQMRYRCLEGNGECIYNIGVEDNGTMTGITYEEYIETIKNINLIAIKNNYSVNLLSSTEVKNKKSIYEVLIREINENKYIDIKVAVAGNADCGKCLDPKTPIIMYNGEIKYIKDVVVGDILMGDDFTPRKVLKLYNGETEMFEIFQTKGMNYKITKNHILSLKFGKPTMRKYKKKYITISHIGNGILEYIYFDTYIDACNYMLSIKNNIETVDISLNEYLKQSKNWKDFFYGYSVGADYKYKNSKNKGIYYNNTISGARMGQINVLSERKNPTEWKPNNRPLMSKIKVEKLEVSEYNGFELDGNGRFLLEDFTVTHNSSTIGSLITGKNDNGRGLTRSFVFNYVHELKSGRTSSVAHQILGFDNDGKIVNNQGLNRLSWSEIISKSSKIISFFDLAGHEKYLHTTIMGLTSSSPDICMIMVDANNGIKPMTKEHIFLCVTLKIPFVIVITKIDICKDRQNILKETIQSINKFLKYPGIRRIPVPIKTLDDIILSCKNIYSESISPIFQLSCVTGEGMDKFKTFLNIVGKKIIQKIDDDVVEFHIDNIFNVYGFGLVLGGHLINGTISVGDKLLIGPYTGSYDQIIIRSVYSKKTPVQRVSSGSYVCLGVKKVDKTNIKKGNVIISNKNEKLIIKKFVAEITVLRTHSTTVKIGYEPLFHAHSIRQTTRIIEIHNKKNARGENIIKDDNILRNGDIAKIVLEFKYHPEYLKIGTRFILAEGKCKIVGEVLSD